MMTSRKAKAEFGTRRRGSAAARCVQRPAGRGSWKRWKRVPGLAWWRHRTGPLPHVRAASGSLEMARAQAVMAVMPLRPTERLAAGRPIVRRRGRRVVAGPGPGAADQSQERDQPEAKVVPLGHIL